MSEAEYASMLVEYLCDARRRAVVVVRGTLEGIATVANVEDLALRAKKTPLVSTRG